MGNGKWSSKRSITDQARSLGFGPQSPKSVRRLRPLHGMPGPRPAHTVQGRHPSAATSGKVTAPGKIGTHKGMLTRIELMMRLADRCRCEALAPASSGSATSRWGSLRRWLTNKRTRSCNNGFWMLFGISSLVCHRRYVSVLATRLPHKSNLAILGAQVLHLVLTDPPSALTTAMLASLVTGLAAAMGDCCNVLSLPQGKHLHDGSDAEELTRDAQRCAPLTDEEALGRTMSPLSL